MSGNIDEVIDFWFGKLDNQLSPAQNQRIWYSATTDDDAFILQKFEHLYLQALNGSLEYWMSSAKGAMALIVLLDQMPRNMFRGTEQAFLSDHLALKYCLQGIEKGYDKQLALIERVFFYHPLEHAEDLALQQQCVSHFQSLQQVYTDESHQELIRHSLSFAKQHEQIIAQYGRFPYRNEVLGRESSDAELQFLKTGVNFGQTT
ncbi:DUF924 family protein [Thalassomonas sp. M1454]|uniref:DUF924 family protein n=1 Tax=Thalassomonas sp. M1454 TaxID=2594477 RepID=UPI00117D59B3|nr:DUF924 family protein [Thalassomonas sp. M1454]TRX55698.1 DUF924 domain-containing protein [Thalassomonas sp. M1454]